MKRSEASLWSRGLSLGKSVCFRLLDAWKLILLVLICLVTIYSCTKAVLVNTNPILVGNELAEGEIFINGKKVEFDGGRPTGVESFLPWDHSYIVEVRSRHGVQKRRVYPWHEESSSGGIFVDKKGVTYGLKNEVID